MTLARRTFTPLALFAMLLALLLLPAGGVRAQQAGDAGATSAPSASGNVPQPYIRYPKERYRLFVFGDKMATGLLAGLWRVLKNDARFVAKGRFNAGSGLVRLSYYDWQRAISQVLESRPVDIGVVMLGINDARDIFIAGQRIPFGSEEWKRIYAARVDNIMETFRNAGVALYWVGLPPVRDAQLNAAARLITEVIRARAAANGVRFIDIYDKFAGPDGAFAENGPDINGQIVRLRARNGIHFIRPGNTKLAALVMEVIRRDVEQAAQAPADGALAALPGAGVASDKPFVGRAAPDGAPLYESPASLPGADTVYLARNLSGAQRAARDTLQVLRRSAAPDSAADKLFRTGLWPDAPPARVDNFSAPPEAFEPAGAAP